MISALAGTCRSLAQGSDALAELGLGAAQQAGEGVLRQRVRHRRDGAEGGRRVGAEGDGDRVALAGMLQLPVAVVQGAAAVREPAHDQLVAADHLHAVDAEVLPRLLRPARDDQGPGDQRAGVAGPAGLDRQLAQVDVVALAARWCGRADCAPASGPCPAPCAAAGLVPGVASGPSAGPAGAGRRAVRRSRAGPRRSRRPCPAPRAARCRTGSPAPGCRGPGVLEQQRRAAGAQGAVADLGHLQVRVDLGADALEFAALLESVDEIAQVAVAGGHGAVAREPATCASWTGRTRRWSSCP
jgi:hypothetical protein